MDSSRRRLTVALAASLAVAVPAPAQAADPATSAARACKSIKNPYPNTRYEGVPLSRIRATRVRCRSARRFVRAAHRRAMNMPPPASGVGTFTFRGWRVTADLRPDSDRYVAKRGRKKISWRF